jgi:hypothetical protein
MKKFCPDCRFYNGGSNGMMQYRPDCPPQRPYCTHEEGRALTGEYMYLHAMRESTGACGPDGALFEAKS